MIRGNIVIARAPGEFTTKARPYVIVQSDETVGESATVSLCPLTSLLSGNSLIRIFVEARAANGLKRGSEIAVDLITTMRKSRIEEIVGCLTLVELANVDSALKRWLAL